MSMPTPAFSRIGRRWDEIHRELRSSFCKEFSSPGRNALFLVIRTDHEQQVADLLSFTFNQPAMEVVPFGMLEAWELESLLMDLPPC
jgi:hypothetical protein